MHSQYHSNLLTPEVHWVLVTVIETICYGKECITFSYLKRRLIQDDHISFCRPRGLPKILQVPLNFWVDSFLHSLDIVAM